MFSRGRKMVEMVTENQLTVIAELTLPVIDSNTFNESVVGQNVIVPQVNELEDIFLGVSNTDGEVRPNEESIIIDTNTCETHSASCVNNEQSESVPRHSRELGVLRNNQCYEHSQNNISSAENGCVVSEKPKEMEHNSCRNPDEKVGEAGKRKIVVDERKENKRKN